MLKTCSKCGVEKHCSQFYKNIGMTDGRLNQCKSCKSVDSNAYYHRVLSPKQIARDCVICKQRFVPKQCGAKACSKLCQRRLGSRNYKRKVAAENKKRICVETDCAYCGSTFVRRTYQQSYCSATCKDRRGRMVAKQVHAQLYISKRDGIENKQCPECGDVFSPRDDRQIGCSVRCGSMISNRQRYYIKRVQLHNGTADLFNPIHVLERDGWRCMACGKKTPHYLRGSKDNAAPELDHIVPLSCGGDHTIKNTQCLCKSCNCSKRVRSMESFMVDKFGQDAWSSWLNRP